MDDSPGNAAATVPGQGGADVPDEFSQAPVRYSDGVLDYEVTDLSAAFFGTDWTQTRSWTNSSAYATDSVNGFGTVDDQMPHLVQAGGSTLALIETGVTARYFDLVNGDYQERFGGQGILTHDTAAGMYTLTDLAGTVFTFADFSADVPAGEQGALMSETDAAGNFITLTRNADGTLAEAERNADVDGMTISQAFVYSYLPAGDPNAGRLASVALEQQTGTSGWTTIRAVDYVYYDGVEPYGNLGDLQTATIVDGNGNALETYYYRYYVAGEAGGYQHALEFVVDPQSYAQLAAAVGNPLTATDAEVANYAEFDFSYDSEHRVIQEVVQGAGCSACTAGMGTYTYSYTTSSNPAGVDSWAVRTVETLPDGSEEIVYTNAYGAVMLESFEDATTGQHTINFYQYNAQGQLVMTAAPSAVTGYDDTYADLLHWTGSGYLYLNNTQGLITLYGYADSTTATATTAGDVAGYQQYTAIQQGQTGTAGIQETYRYYQRVAGTASVAPIASTTVYRNWSDPTSGETTTYSYSWYTGTTALQSMTVTDPAVTTDQNGPGTASAVTTYFDTYGNAIWVQDADGYLRYTAYDIATGAVVESIDDVNTADAAEFANLPSGWATPQGGGLNLVTGYQVDDLGRVTEQTDPDGNTTYIVYNDVDHEVRTYTGWNSATGMPTGPTQVVRDDWANGYTERLTMSATPHLTGGVPDGTEAIADLQTLTRSYTDTAGQVVAIDDYFALDGLTYATTAHLGTLGVNYYETVQGYDDHGLLDRTVSPTRTITRTVYDGLGQPVSVWVGTNDTPATDYWSPTNPAGMVMVTAYVYDNGGAGDGNLTAEIDYPGDGAAPRETDYFYDWRDRLVAIKAGVQAMEDTTTYRPITYYTYDNLNEVVATAVYDGDGVTIGETNGVPDAPAADLLRAYSTASYDNQGRVIQTATYEVDQTSGAISATALTTNNWYDRRGDVIESAAPGGLVTKTTYDGAERAVVTYTTNGGSNTSWAGAFSVAGDIVLQQDESVYDADGNVIEQITRDRFDSATGTGALGIPSSGTGDGLVPARVYYTGMYYDAANRLVATVDVGTNGSATWTRPSAVPDRSDTVLVTSESYSAGGWLEDEIDPRGIDTHYEYDNLGRAIETIDAYTDGVPTAESNQTTLYAYDGSDHVVMQTSVLPGGLEEQTQYVYGVSIATGSAIDSNDLLSQTRYPNPVTGIVDDTQDTTQTVNALGRVITATDRNGTTHTYSYDVLGRLVSDAVTTLGAGVDGSVQRIDYGYDALGNTVLITSYDAPTGGDIVNQVERVYNGLDQLTAEYQSNNGPVDEATTPAVLYAYTEMAGGVNNSRLVSMTYPDGRVLDYNYASGIDDQISRLTSISDSSGVLESYTYLGLDTIVQRVQPQAGTELTYIAQAGQPNGDAGDPYVGLDRFGRIADQRWLDTGSGTATAEVQYGYDPDGNVLYAQNMVNGAFSDLYHGSGPGNGYDALNQLTAYEQGTLSASSGSSVPDTVASPTDSQSWTLGALGNWSGVTTNGSTQARTSNLQNETTGVGSATLGYDTNGNLTTDQAGNQLVYNAWNRLVAVKDSSGATQATYSYDGLGRRVIEVNDTVQTALYYSSSWQVLEERSASGAVSAQYVWSAAGVDTLVLRDRDSTGGGTLNERLYVQQDANDNVTALVDTTGTVVERYAYEPYGAVTVLAPDWTTRTSSAYGWQYLFQGGQYLAAAGLYDFRNREYSPALGRWTQTDPLGYSAGDTDLYRTEGNNPATYTDPSGLFLGTVGFGLIGAGIGAIAGGATGSNATWYDPTTWNSNRMAAGAVTGGLFGAAIGSVLDTGGGSLLAMSLEGGLFWGGMGTLFGGGILSGCDNIEWNKLVKYGIISAIGGAAGEFAVGFASAFFGCGLLSNLASAAIGTTFAALVRQSAETALGERTGLDFGEAAGEGGAAVFFTAAFHVATGSISTSCFAAGTPLLTPDGARPIEQFRPGDMVLSRSEHDPGGPLEAKRVEAVFIHTGIVIELHIGGQLISTTSEHPFWVVGRGWVAAGALRSGDLLLGARGIPLPIEYLSRKGAVSTVYNLRVQDYHTYFVGSYEWGFSVWAHNANCFRALREEDVAAIESGQRIMPKGEGGTIIDHIQGHTDTRYISVSRTAAGTVRFQGSAGVAEIDLAIALETGSGIVPHEQVVQVARRYGTAQDVRNVISAQELLITGGIDPNAVINVRPGK